VEIRYEAFGPEDHDHVTFSDDTIYTCCNFEGVVFWDCNGKVLFRDCTFDAECRFSYCQNFSFEYSEMYYSSFEYCGDITLYNCKIYACPSYANYWDFEKHIGNSSVTQCTSISVSNVECFGDEMCLDSDGQGGFKITKQPQLIGPQWWSR